MYSVVWVTVGLLPLWHDLKIHIISYHHIFASRWCADYARASYAVAGEARVARVTFVGLGEAVWC